MKIQVKPAGVERSTRILDAGLKLMLANGLRGTTMEAIAREAGLAKATLYNYFPDKTVVYSAIAHRLFGQMREEVENQLSLPGEVELRIANALAAKHKIIFRLLEGSAHAEELYGDKGRFAAKEVSRFAVWLEERIALELTKAGIDDATKYSQLIIACAQGISGCANYAEQIGPAIRLVSQKLLART